MPEWTAYVDESGNRSGTMGGASHFVLTCVVGSPRELRMLAGSIRRLKLALVPHADPADWELHAGDMFHDRGGTPLGSLGAEKQMDVMRKIIRIVCASNVVIFGVAVESARMRKKNMTATKITEHTTTLLVERLDKFAQEKKVKLRMVSDNTYEKYRQAMKRALAPAGTNRKTPPRGKARLVVGIDFVDSMDSPIVQAVDALAYAINRSLEGDTMFGDLLGDIRRKAWNHKKHSVLRMETGRRIE